MGVESGHLSAFNAQKRMSDVVMFEYCSVLWNKGSVITVTRPISIGQDI